MLRLYLVHVISQIYVMRGWKFKHQSPVDGQIGSGALLLMTRYRYRFFSASFFVFQQINPKFGTIELPFLL